MAHTRSSTLNKKKEKVECRWNTNWIAFVVTKFKTLWQHILWLLKIPGIRGIWQVIHHRVLKKTFLKRKTLTQPLCFHNRNMSLLLLFLTGTKFTGRSLLLPQNKSLNQIVSLIILIKHLRNKNILLLHTLRK